MSGLSTFWIGLQQMFSDPTIFLLVAGGVFFGIVFGSIPGLTGALAISLILPFTYKITASYGLSVLIGIYVGSISGGLISAILLNIPGTPASLVTCFDGWPMSKKSPGKALVIGTFSSLIGGIVGGMAMILISGPLAKFALKFGYWEYFAMGLMGLFVVVALVGKDKLKGFIAATIGLIIGLVGTDSVSTVTRYTFGSWQLNGGFDILPVLMGLFALCEILVSIPQLKVKATVKKVDKVPLLPKREWMKGTWRTMLTSSLIGTYVGILPGVGQTTASLLAYTQAKQSSKNPDKFGTGCEEGLVASEAANNAVCGGALIPMMAVGIPGDVITSILLGALVLHGLQPGALLFNSKPEVVGVIFASFIIANIIMYLMQLGLMRAFVQMLRVPMRLLYPIILCMCMVGAMTTNNRVFDAVVLIGFGIVGYFLTQNDYPLPPMVLGFVLAQIIEKNFRTAMIASDGNILDIFTRPIALVLLAIGVGMAVIPPIRKAIKNRKSAKLAAEGAPVQDDDEPQDKAQ